jgi:hypothetical protein
MAHTSFIECRSNFALELLWDALDGDELQAASNIVRGLPGRRIDDTSRGNSAMETHTECFYFLGPYNCIEYKQFDIH